MNYITCRANINRAIPRISPRQCGATRGLGLAQASSESTSVKPGRFPIAGPCDNNHVAAFGPGRLGVFRPCRPPPRCLWSPARRRRRHENVLPIVLDRKRPPPGNYVFHREYRPGGRQPAIEGWSNTRTVKDRPVRCACST